MVCVRDVGVVVVEWWWWCQGWWFRRSVVDGQSLVYRRGGTLSNGDNVVIVMWCEMIMVMSWVNVWSCGRDQCVSEDMIVAIIIWLMWCGSLVIGRSVSDDDNDGGVLLYLWLWLYLHTPLHHTPTFPLHFLCRFPLSLSLALQCVKWRWIMVK